MRSFLVSIWCATALLVTGSACRPAAADCTGNDECPPGESCVSAGGIFSSGGICVDEDLGAESDTGPPDARGARFLQVGGSSSDVASAVVAPATEGGPVYIAGRTEGVLELGESTVRGSAFLAKWSGGEDGSVEWVASPDGSRSITDLVPPSDDGTVMAVGESRENAGFVVRFGTEGSVRWSTTLDTASTCTGIARRSTAQDRAVIACDQREGDSSRAALFGVGADGSVRSVGDRLELAASTATDIDSDGDGRVYVSGFGGSTLGAADTDRDGFVAALDSMDTELWTVASDREGRDALQSVGVLPSEALFAGGSAEMIPNAADGGLVQKFDFDGNEVWTNSEIFAEPVEHLAIQREVNRIHACSSVQYATIRPNGREIRSRRLLKGVDITVRDLDLSSASGRVYVVGSTPEALPNHSNQGGVDGFLHSFIPD